MTRLFSNLYEINKNTFSEFRIFFKEKYESKRNIKLKDFSEYHESLQLMVFIDFFYSLGFNINVYEECYDIYLIENHKLDPVDLEGLFTLGVLFVEDGIRYYKNFQEYTGSILTGYRTAILDLIKFTNSLTINQN